MCTVKTNPRALLSRRRFLGGALALSAAGLVAGGRPQRARAAAMPRAASFDVIRFGQTIGRHQVSFEGTPDALKAISKIDIEVVIAGVRIFDYHHQGTETYRGPRLVAYASETFDNDSTFKVEGKATDDGFAVIGRKVELVAPADILVGTFWNPAIVTRDRILDPKRGRLYDMRVTGKENLVLPILGAPTPVTRYDIIGKLSGAVFYDEGGDWVGARLTARGSDVQFRLRG